jgi:sugar phosphate isomerase/epimerase
MQLLAADWNHWPDGLSPAEIASAASAAGVAGLELGVYDTSVELAPQCLDEWRRLGDEHGVPVRMLLFSMPPDRWPTGGLTAQSERGRLYEQVESLLHIGSMLGLETVGLWPGADLPGADRDSFLTAISEIAVLAHRAGMRIAIEPKPGTLVATADDVTDASDRAADNDAIGVLLDTGHEHAAGRDPAAIASSLGSRLLHIHLGDSAGDPDADLPPGRLHPLGPFLTTLDALTYEGAMSPDAYGAVAAHTITGVEALAETVRQLAAYRASTSDNSVATSGYDNEEAR